MDKLEREIKLMALDNLVYEHTNTILRSCLVKLSKNYQIPTDVRLKIQDTIKEGDVFFKNGHDSLKGLTDAAGKPINIDV